MQVRVDVKKDGSLNLQRTIFQFTCYGEFDKPRKLLLRQGQVNRPVAEVCKDRVVRTAFNQDGNAFQLNVEKSTHPTLGGASNHYAMFTTAVFYHLKYGAFPYDILSSFYTFYHLTPTWIDAHQSWGWFNPETGLWTGATGLVSRLDF